MTEELRTLTSDLDSLLKLIRCPVTQTKLIPASDATIASLNEQVEKKVLVDRIGRDVSTRFEAGLVNESKTVFYPVFKGIVKLVVDEAIQLSEFSPTAN